MEGDVQRRIFMISHRQFICFCTIKTKKVKKTKCDLGQQIFSLCSIVLLKMRILHREADLDQAFLSKVNLQLNDYILFNKNNRTFI